MMFKITEKEGIDYSKISGDKNKIHIDDLTGYNSMFGEKICHGTLALSKILKKKELKKIILSEKKFNISADFVDFIKYNKNAYIKKKNNKFYITQDKKKRIYISVSSKNNFYFLKIDKKKNYYFKKKLTFLKNRYDLIYSLLSYISNYVGNKYPGKNSLIRSININFNKDFYKNDEQLVINSYKINKGLPLIKNILLFKNFKIEFETLERPFVKKNKFIIKKDLKQKIKIFKENILIIGGSSGIGNDIFNLFKINKKILKIVTFNQNKIKSKLKDSIFYKIDVLKDLKKLNYLINKYGPIKIFYFPTTKIYFEKKINNKTMIQYKKIFLTIPLKIIKDNKTKIISIFYPSTKFIDENKESDYSKVKLLAENLLKKSCKKHNINYKSLRFPAINSKQSISLLNPTPENFFQYLNKYPKLFDKIF